MFLALIFFTESVTLTKAVRPVEAIGGSKSSHQCSDASRTCRPGSPTFQRTLSSLAKRYSGSDCCGDFERCTADAAKPRNVTQFLQFLATPTVMELLSSKRIPVDVPRLRSFGAEYKTRLATLEATGSSPDQGAEGPDWDFVENLGLTGEPRDEPVSTDVTAEHPRGRAARKLQTKRMRADADLRAAQDTLRGESDVKGKVARLPMEEQHCVPSDK